MTVDRREVERVAGLARLTLERAEADRLRDEMNRILEHADRLRDAAGRGGEASSVGEGPDRDSGLRDPGIVAPDRLETGIDAFAPALEEGFFVVPPPTGVTADDGGEEP